MMMTMVRMVTYGSPVRQKLDADTQRKLTVTLRGQSRNGRGIDLLVDTIPEACVFEVFGSFSLFQGSVRVGNATAEAIAGRILICVSQVAGIE
jgi:hypothetical protein